MGIPSDRRWAQARSRVAAGAGVAMLGLGAYVGLLVAGVIEGSSSVRPGAAQLALAIRNDLPQTVVVRRCGEPACHAELGAIRLAAGVSARFVVPAANVIELFVVEDESGRTLGCLPVRAHDAYERLAEKIREASVTTSAARGCPGRPVMPAVPGSR